MFVIKLPPPPPPSPPPPPPPRFAGVAGEPEILAGAGPGGGASAGARRRAIRPQRLRHLDAATALPPRDPRRASHLLRDRQRGAAETLNPKL